MILEAAIINITRNLDIINQNDIKSHSSHEKLKEEALACLSSLIENAPVEEFVKLTDAADYDILIGYLVNVLCHVSKSDKSRDNRSNALRVLLVLFDRLTNIHDAIVLSEVCATKPLRYALPGLSSALFKLVMSDTKLPRNLIIVALELLSKSIKIAFTGCRHNSCSLSGKNLSDTCDNIAIRFNFLIDYTTNNSSHLAKEIKFEVLNLCESIACGTKVELVRCCLPSIIRYIAFITSSTQPLGELRHEAELKVMILVDSVKDTISLCTDQTDGLDDIIMKNSLQIMDNLQDNYSNMLQDERESQLSILYGYLRLLPPDSMTTLLELEQARGKLLSTLIKLTEFSSQQPFLFLTDSHIGDSALESCNKIYTVEKRFKFITNFELNQIIDCCKLIGESIELNLIGDLFRNELSEFSIASNLFVSHLILKGILRRKQDKNYKIMRLSEYLLTYYIDQTTERHQELNAIFSQGREVTGPENLKVVIAIETITTLVEIQLNHCTTSYSQVAILKPLLCPLLNWASSHSRAVSEASLSSLTSIARIYERDSIKSLIEENIDYIVDGVSRMLSTFPQNSEVTNVLAIAFKLSSIDSFFYFKDIYERIFKLLATYHLTQHSVPIALLFYRTLSILDQWKRASLETSSCNVIVPLKTEDSIKGVIVGLDIKRRIDKLEKETREADKIRSQIDDLETNEPDVSDEIVKEIESKELPFAMRGNISNKEQEQVNNSTDDGENERDSKKSKLPEIELTEKILTHCIGLMSSNFSETKILALKTAACGFRILADDEDTLLPLVHQLWSPLVSRLTSDYRANLEINLCAFECLVAMAACAKDFIKGRTLESIIPRLCLFLESQAHHSLDKKEYGPYCMSVAFKCQLMIVKSLGALTYDVQLAYSNLWRIIEVCLIYLNPRQVESLRVAARDSLYYLVALDTDCVWYLAKERNLHRDLPFELVYARGWQ